MSFVTRNFFDKIQNSTTFTKWRLPSPPYYDPNYWDRVYKDLTPDDCIEWGGFDLNGLLKFRFERVTLDEHHGSDVGTQETDSEKESTFAKWMGIQQHSSPEEASQRYLERRTNNEKCNDTILLLGCGNSKMGEQLLVHGFQGPFLHLDVSSKVIQCMTQRYETYLKQAAVQRMEFIVDDAATGLTSLEPESVGGGVIDKGLLDALHCSLRNIHAEDTSNDDGDPIQNIVASVHRVLQPSRPFVFFSRSSPEYMLRRAFGKGNDARNRRKLWTDISVIKLTDLNVMLYRFIKAENHASKQRGMDDGNTVNSRVTTRGFRLKNKQRKK
ncbi:hypothetical protein HJC23_009869 [Cyclotella cryptica]|uniref:Methyltransferase domain-containing protein n=1 Tax=Cyclotella cryptica TaxID=29204 RepID=A0ABD3QHN7_9STRA|eukprot:CCRYP_006998-RA/>CCRYP_006998-RA protein AED:0.06 eAED:0.06 QI:0/-1/0/1/-1/1/1/0/326